MSFCAKDYLRTRKEIIDRALREYLPPGEPGTKLRRSVVYSIHPGGKRLRPILCLAASELVCGNHENALPAACAVEMIHTYSIIHDDLPSMDDDDIRRGEPANHKVFGEAVATLAGDALLTDAFGIAAKGMLAGGVPPELALRVISVISEAAGSEGMVLGQSLDIEMDGKSRPPADGILDTYLMKTAKMIAASVLSGAIVAGAGQEELSRLRSYSEKIGVAFQIKDDILDAGGGPDAAEDEETGPGAEKHTYLSVAGLRKSEAMVRELTDLALAELELFNRTPNPLREIAVFLREREE